MITDQTTTFQQEEEEKLDILLFIPQERSGAASHFSLFSLSIPTALFYGDLSMLMELMHVMVAQWLGFSHLITMDCFFFFFEGGDQDVRRIAWF